MVESFPYGKAPFWLMVSAIASLLLVAWLRLGRAERRPDLVLALSAPNHVAAYRAVEQKFEREHGIEVALQLVHQRALTTRLQNAMLAGTAVPDLVELPFDAMRYFGRGPVQDVGFVDLTERLQAEGYRQRLVEARLSLWSKAGRVFALPHDVHPVMLAYRADIVEGLGIDVERLQTWDDFVAAGRRVTVDRDGDGAIDRFMIDLSSGANSGVRILLLQRGINLFDENANLTFNQPLTVDTLAWYVRQTYGSSRIAFDCGWGQSLAKAMADGFVLFHLTPDWRTNVFQLEAPRMAGKLKLMPLPAWQPGGRRTSVWGGSGLALTKRGQHPELAWQLARELYFTESELGQRFRDTNIIPALTDAWDLPEFDEPNPYFSGQRLGRLFAQLAPEVPPVWNNPYTILAENELLEAVARAGHHYETRGEPGLRELLEREVDTAEAHVRRYMSRNVFTRLEAGAGQGEGGQP